MKESIMEFMIYLLSGIGAIVLLSILMSLISYQFEKLSFWIKARMHYQPLKEYKGIECRGYYLRDNHYLHYTTEKWFDIRIKLGKFQHLYFLVSDKKC